VVEGYGRPTAGAYARFDDLEAELRPRLDRLDALFEEDLLAFNEALAAAGAAGVLVPERCRAPLSDRKSRSPRPRARWA